MKCKSLKEKCKNNWPNLIKKEIRISVFQDKLKMSWILIVIKIS
jgi:hypothetical protein